MKAALFTALTPLLMLIAGASFEAEAAETALSEKQKIEALIKNIEELKETKFIRNGSEYDAASAGKFLRSKWRSQEAELKTAQDFIEKAASVSSTSGKAYVIRFKDGKEVPCGEYLKGELKKLEEKK